ncbi:MAG: hypothetical protein JF616_05165 [Fibrobacteres bacterium]|nr:hypothetical protein [Fibrobacterota bacterium]
MNISRILKPVLGAVFLIAGLCLPFAARSLSPDWNPQRTLIQNALECHVQISPDTRKPIFVVVKKGEENPSAYLVQFEETQLFMEFDPSVTATEIRNAVQSHFPGNHIPPSDPVSGRVRFEGWSGHAAVSKPFGWVFAASLGLLLAGWLMTRAIWGRARS